MDNYDLASLQARKNELLQSNADAKARHKKPTGAIITMSVSFILAYVFFLVYFLASRTWILLFLAIFSTIMIFVGLFSMIGVFNNNKPINATVRRNNIELRDLEYRIAAAKQMPSYNGSNSGYQSSTSSSYGSNQRSTSSSRTNNRWINKASHKRLMGVQKALDVYDDRVALVPLKVSNSSNSGSDDVRAFPYNTITGIDVKKASGLDLGYIYFEVEGKKTNNPYNDDNSWVYDSTIEDEVDEIVKFIRERVY